MEQITTTGVILLLITVISCNSEKAPEESEYWCCENRPRLFSQLEFPAICQIRWSKGHIIPNRYPNYDADLGTPDKYNPKTQIGKLNSTEFYEENYQAMLCSGECVFRHFNLIDDSENVDEMKMLDKLKSTIPDGIEEWHQVIGSGYKTCMKNVVAAKKETDRCLSGAGTWYLCLNNYLVKNCPEKAIKKNESCEYMINREL